MGYEISSSPFQLQFPAHYYPSTSESLSSYAKKWSLANTCNMERIYHILKLPQLKRLFLLSFERWSFLFILFNVFRKIANKMNIFYCNFPRFYLNVSIQKQSKKFLFLCIHLKTSIHYSTLSNFGCKKCRIAKMVKVKLEYIISFSM